MNTTTCNETTCSPTNETEASPRYQRPRYSTEKRESAWEVRALVPGVHKDDLEIEFNQDVLSIEAKRSDAKPESWRPVSVRQRNTDGYTLRLAVNADIDRDKVSATLEEGVLILTLPFSEAAKPRVIPVQ